MARVVVQCLLCIALRVGQRCEGVCRLWAVCVVGVDIGVHYFPRLIDD